MFEDHNDNPVPADVIDALNARDALWFDDVYTEACERGYDDEEVAAYLSADEAWGGLDYVDTRTVRLV